MAETTKLQVFTLENLQTYDPLLKEWVLTQISGEVTASDVKSLKTVTIEGNVLKFYRVEEPVGETTPAYTIELPEQDLSGLLTKLENATAGHVVTVSEDGTTITDSGVALTDLATKDDVEAVENKADKNAEDIAAINDEETGILKQAEDYADKKDVAIKEAKDAADNAQADVDALEEKVGKVEDGKTVVEMIADAQAAATYDDTQVKTDIQINKNAIALLNDDSTVKGSVDYKIAQAVAAIMENPDETMNSINELVTWCNEHAEDALALSNTVAGHTTDIEALEELVGTKGVAEQIASAIESALKIEGVDKYALATDLASAIARIAALELKAHEHENEEVLDGVTAEKVANWDKAKTDSEANASEIEAIKEQITKIEENAYDDTELRGLVEDNANDIDTLEASLAEGGATANAIADAKKAGTDAAIAASQAQADIDSLEAQVLTDKSAQNTKDSEQDVAILEAKNAADNAQSEVDLVEEDLANTKETVATNTSNIASNTDRITALENLTGSGYEAIPDSDIQALFPSEEV